MKRLLQKYGFELLFVCVVLFLYVALRSIHFTKYLNFSSEQASFSLKALELFQNKKIELIGPPISWRMGARYFFQGSITYYAMMVFLFLGKWDPAVSSYFMMFCGALMVIPLYLGVRMMSNKKAAALSILFYSYVPLYIDYSRFFWNPNLQFIFSPFVILFMGLYKKYKKPLFLLMVGLFLGLLLLFHYQLILVIIGLLTYYIIGQIRNTKSESPNNNKYQIMQKMIVLILGFLIGFSPMLLFELRNQFYNTQTLFLFLRNYKTVFPSHKGEFVNFFGYYSLSSSLLICVTASIFLSRFTSRYVIIVVGIILVSYNLYRLVPSPTHAFGMVHDWNYSYELKAHEIISKEHLKNYNIVNLGYDTLAQTQKYLLKIDGVKENFDDYYHNTYLFVITDEKEYMHNPAYEVNTFTPSKVVKKWNINSRYMMFLLKKI